MNEQEQWRELGQQLRVDSIRAAAAAGSGHPTSSMSAADLMAVLLAKHLRYDFDQPENPLNDHLVFSKGHASPLVYSIFRAAGAITDEELLSFRKMGSRFQGHPTPILPWVDVATGSLGQGLPIAVGIALAGKRLDRLPFRVWVVCGDSEMAEGSMWEAFAAASHEDLDNLTAIIDVNRLGQRGETMLGWNTAAYARRAEAFGWRAIEIDGHDVAEIDAAFESAAAADGQPVAIIARTLKGKGVAAVENKNGWHGKPLADPDAAIAELGGRRDLQVRPQAPPTNGRPHRFATTKVAAGGVGRRREGGHQARLRRRAGRGRRGRRPRGRARRRGRQLDVLGALPGRPSRPLLRDVHRRAADGGGGGRHAGARLAPVRLDVRGLLRPRVRLHPHGRDQPGQHVPGRLARGRLDRRGRPIPDGARGSGLVPGRARLDRALPELCEPDRQARRADGRPRRHRLPAHDPREHAGALPGRRAVPDRRLAARALVRLRRRDGRRRGDHPARGARGRRDARGRGHLGRG